MVTVKEFANKLLKLKPELQNKEVLVVAPNGLYLDAHIHFKKKDIYDFSLTKENVESIVIKYE